MMNPMANPMLQQMLSPIDPRAEQMKQLMMIMGGLKPQVPQMSGPQAPMTPPIAGMPNGGLNAR